MSKCLALQWDWRGIFQGAVYPALHAMIARWVPPGEKGMFVWTMQGMRSFFWGVSLFKWKTLGADRFTRSVTFFRWPVWNRCDVRSVRCGDQHLRMENCVLRYERAYVSLLCLVVILSLRYSGAASRNHREGESIHKGTNRYYRFEAEGTCTEMIV